MFGHCVWYTISRNHRLSILIRELSNKLNTDFYAGHITLHSRCAERVANHYYTIQCSMTKPWFQIDARVYQTKMLDKNNQWFYAIQQDYNMYNEPRLGKYHVSLAYRLNRPFTKEEVAYVNSLIPTDTIRSCDIYVSLNDCRTVLPRHWKQMKCKII